MNASGLPRRRHLAQDGGPDADPTLGFRTTDHVLRLLDTVAWEFFPAPGIPKTSSWSVLAPPR